MGRFSLACLFVVLAVCYVSAEPTDSERISKLDEVRRGKRDGVLSLNIGHFRKYIESSPRSYSIVVLFIADSTICKPCGPMRHQLGKIAAEYYSLPKRGQSSKPLYFASISIGMQDREFLADYGIEHVPILYHFGAGKSKKFPRKLDTRSSGDSYQVEQEGIGANGMKRFVNDRTGSKLKAIRGDYSIQFAPVVRKMMPMIALAVMSFVFVAALMGWYKQPLFWFVCCLVVYMYSVGGGHYTWINNSPFARVNGDGIVHYIAEGSRNQYVAEGMFVAATCGALTAIAISLNELPRVLPNKAAQNLIGLTLAATGFVCIGLLLSLYQLKMSSYLRYDA